MIGRVLASVELNFKPLNPVNLNICMDLLDIAIEL